MVFKTLNPTVGLVRCERFAGIVLDPCGKEGDVSEGKAFDLPVDLHSNHQ